MRPVVALDVDGVLLPFGKPVEINPTHGFWLNKLLKYCDVAWATSWGNQANVELAPLLGIPELPVVPSKWDVPQWGAPVPLVWVDDMFSELPHPAIAEMAAGREIQFVGPDPHVGLTGYHLQTVAWWTWSWAREAGSV